MKKFITSFAVILVLFCWTFLLVTSSQIAGVRSFIVNSGSMEPAIAKGALVVTRHVDPAVLQAGDVITFIQSINNQQQFITHRIAYASTQKQNVTLKTQGDNNGLSDNWQVAGNAVVGKVAFSVPYMGSFVSFARSNVGMMLLVFAPAMLILASQIITIRKQIQTDPIELSIYETRLERR